MILNFFDSFANYFLAIRARVSTKKKMKRKQYRHELQIVSVYKSNFTLMKREYLWISNGCCPKLRQGREYLLMGRKQRIPVRIENSADDDNFSSLLRNKRKVFRNRVEADWRYEIRLFMDFTDYWRPWKQKYSAEMNKLTRKIKCEKKNRTKLHRKLTLS